MNTTQAGIVLRHLRDLAARASGGADDRQLLEQFTAGREEPAFAELVRRHGPMVLGVCRRVLHNRDDADDAFQATFLMLARKAGSISQGESVGGWLYQVAHHTALKARAGAAARQRREQRADSRQPADPLAEVTGRELLAVLDEELHKLPERLRLPLVLCYLEGKTRDEAARDLGWSLGTLKRRLEQGRASLHARLARRGLSLGVLLATAVSTGTVSAALADVTAGAALLVAAGKQAAVSARVLGLLTTGPRKAIGAALVAATLVLTTVGLFAYRPPAPAADSPRAPTETRPAEPAAPAKKEMTVSGRVLDADGKPVPGARVAVIGLAERPYRGRIGYREYETLGSGEADKEGHFRLDCVAESATRGPIRQVIASAPGHGLGWCSLPRDTEKGDVTVKLPPERVIRGRLIDLQGQAAEKVKLHVAEVAVVPGAGGSTSRAGRPGDTSATREGTAPPAYYGFPTPPGRLEPWPAAITTDAEGHFVLRGLGEGMAITLLVTDKRFARQRLVVRTTAEDRPEAFEQALDPPHLLEGKVVGADTGKPIGKKVLLQVYGADGRTGRVFGELRLWTDEQGRFRVNCPPGRVFLSSYPPDGSPYLSRATSFVWPKGKEKHEVQVELPRGVLVRGKVSEAGSGKPVPGAVVSYFLREDNPFAHFTITSWRQTPGEFVRTKADGTFEAAVYPGQGHLMAKGPSRDYVLQRLDTKELTLGKAGGAPLYAEAVTPLDLKAGAEPQEVSLTLRRGVTIRGLVLDPDGKPVKEAVLTSATHLRDLGDQAWFHHYSFEPVAVKEGRFELTGCDPKAKFPICVLDRHSETGARVVLSGADAKEEATVRLQPCGKAVVRYVDGDGKPIKDRFPPPLQLILDPADVFTSTGAGGSGGSSSGPLVPRSDGEGRVTVSGLIPGATYRYFDGAKAREFTAEAGKTRELPDIVLSQPPK
jgi:RNA polymerase sigma factor (sigma-70 family)